MHACSECNNRFSVLAQRREWKSISSVHLSCTSRHSIRDEFMNAMWHTCPEITSYMWWTSVSLLHIRFHEFGFATTDYFLFLFINRVTASIFYFSCSFYLVGVYQSTFTVFTVMTSIIKFTALQGALEEGPLAYHLQVFKRSFPCSFIYSIIDCKNSSKALWYYTPSIVFLLFNPTAAYAHCPWQ